MTHVVPVQYALRQHRDLFEHPCLSDFRLEDLFVSPELDKANRQAYLVESEVVDLLSFPASRGLRPALHHQLTLASFLISPLIAEADVRQRVRIR